MEHDVHVYSIKLYMNITYKALKVFFKCLKPSSFFFRPEVSRIKIQVTLWNCSEVKYCKILEITAIKSKIICETSLTII